MTVRIVTDSSCDLPADVIARYGICVVPLYINIGQQGYLDGIDITRAEFYKKLPTFPIYPTTAVPSPQKFHAIYDALAEEGANQVLSIHISTSLSSTVNVAQVAARETTSLPVTVFDSRQLSLGTGFLVETASRVAQAGCSVSQILPLLNEQIKRTHVFAVLDTLQFLRRSGRMNPLLSSIGELVQIKPLLKMYDGKASAERIPTHILAMKRLVQLLHEYSPFEQLAFVHTDASSRAQALLQEVKQFLPSGEIWPEQINPVLGAHIGPGVVGFACVSIE
ncbi:MAG TPA: DegV family protein [Anaerolineaceae bacterium]|nr:DegV family protein [Anaerolineaceae bacterium]